MEQKEKLAVATLGGGCFWCLEAVYLELKGVSKVVSGYSGGAVANPSYQLVCTGTTGHAEVVQVTFDPGKISYGDLLRIHLSTHDPTLLNRQGADVGTQYRSVILAHNQGQREMAEKIIEEMAPSFDKKMVTEVIPFQIFYKAEAHHQNYYQDNPEAGYCMAVISPKLEKFRRLFKEKLRVREH